MDTQRIAKRIARVCDLLRQKAEALSEELDAGLAENPPPVLPPVPFKPVPFWFTRPETQEEVDRMEAALEEARNWLNGVTDQCQRCKRRTPIGKDVCEECSG